MQKQLLTFILILESLCLSAQELTVKSFALKPTDLAASTNARYDNNGTACALVKVQLTISGAQFEPNVITPVDYKVNEYWVYLPAGTKHLKIKHPQYLTKDVVFAEYDINKLESRCTYEMIVTARKLIDVVVVAPVESSLYINGEAKGLGSWRGSLSEGFYRMEARKESHRPSVETVPINENTDTIWLAPPTPIYGNLNVNSFPDGATVILDNKKVGTTPSIFSSIIVGEHHLVLERSGYAPNESNVMIEEGRITNQEIILSRKRASSDNDKRTHLYIALGYNMIALPGPTLSVGMNLGVHQIEAGLVLGTKKTDDFYYTSLKAAFQYKATRLQLKYGYEFRFTDYFSIVPQVGMAVNLYHGTLTNHSDGYRQDLENAHSFSALIGARFLVSINRRIKIHVTPEYTISVKKNVDCGWLCWYDKTCQKWSTGMNGNIGIIINIF